MVLVHHGDAKGQLGQVHVILVEFGNQLWRETETDDEPGEGRDMRQDKTPLRRQGRDNSRSAGEKAAA
jgi:hypothetical protein